MRRWATIVAVLSALSGAAGCSSGLRAETGQSAVISNAAPGEVLRVAGDLLQRRYDRVRVDRSAGRVTTEPIQYVTRSESGSVRALYGGRSRMRQSAVVTVAPRNGETIVRVRVAIERKDTTRANAVHSPAEFRLNDSPGVTPIERDAATSVEQNEVWTYVKRDLSQERAFLEQLQDYFAIPEAAPASGEGASAPS